MNLNLSTCALVNFTENTLSSLQNLFLDNNPSIDEDLLIAQLQNVSTLMSITLKGSNISTAGIDQIKNDHAGIIIDV